MKVINRSDGGRYRAPRLWTVVTRDKANLRAVQERSWAAVDPAVSVGCWWWVTDETASTNINATMELRVPCCDNSTDFEFMTFPRTWIDTTIASGYNVTRYTWAVASGMEGRGQVDANASQDVQRPAGRDLLRYTAGKA
ncbi:hypothetical protein VOLCADRAFT_85843 [Volvox carteri f. nagariensis]|uniref:Uncharacterized protein n=1 Tax=Volvox carteri f. nagariensis TaxID=3068 RepID=D8TH50_VOLCA|nr:uncharacterized protein VOLCADRAFT_85843 [Volvox carteri f. nagariensis]EFJ53009.1 hypothetical protein VOLCADRAFT_85843 [Volvox carteri f. nagariensis]|eukprot:XP_002946014.1 hypothetical protein VOLCADRAFT_85843 [Volvox carteri f. nagariensis]